MEIALAVHDVKRVVVRASRSSLTGTVSKPLRALVDNLYPVNSSAKPANRNDLPIISSPSTIIVAATTS
jgi:hypothetical protein